MQSGVSVHDLLASSFFFLVATCIAVPIFKKMGLGSVLGYLFAGLIVGPFGLKLFNDPKSIIHFAEIGVVFLLFIIGLELNLTKLWTIRRHVFGLGGFQVIATGFALALFLYYGFSQFGFEDLSWNVLVLLGFTLSLSSTAFAVQMMKEKNEFQTPYGQSAFAVLLFQDLAAIPLIAIVPFLVVQTSNSVNSYFLPALKGLVVITLVIFLGRFLLKYLLRIIAQSNVKEVFTAASLLVVIGVSLLMESVGLSMALGAFLSGVILADSEYRHELEADIEPFKGLLLGLFFMAVGMNINLNLFLVNPLIIILVTLVLMAVKFISLLGLSRLMKMNFKSSQKLSLVLSQSGEFGFVILGLALTSQVLNSNTHDTLTLIITFSMALTPFLVLTFEKMNQKKVVEDVNDYDTNFEHSDPQVIIAGFGRYGQMSARLLMMQKIPFTALELSSEHVQTAIKFGYKIYYGDATRLDLLHAAGVDKAKIFIIAIDDVEMALKLTKTLKDHFPKIKIYSRARNRQHVFDLMALNVEVIHREVFSSSLDMAKDMLIGLGFESSRAIALVNKFRSHDEALLKDQYLVLGDEGLYINKTREMQTQLEQLLIEENPN